MGKRSERAKAEGTFWAQWIALLAKSGAFLWGSMLGNFLLAAGKLIVGLCTHSFFLRNHALYNFGMGLAKYFVILGRAESPAQQRRRYRQVGALILGSSAIYLSAAGVLFWKGSNAQYPLALALLVGAVAVGELIFNGCGLFRAYKAGDLMAQAERRTSFASALIGLVLTQTMLLSAAAGRLPAEVNGAVGMFFGAQAALNGGAMLFGPVKKAQGEGERKGDFLKKVPLDPQKLLEKK